MDRPNGSEPYPRQEYRLLIPGCIALKGKRIMVCYFVGTGLIELVAHGPNGANRDWGG